MTSMLDRLLAADIPDPTDFPDNNAAPGLRSFDEAVRCTICRDFYDAPVTLTCGHCFCSACIRSALPEHQNCPTCRKPASEVHIRKDVAMETAVQAWKSARPLILRLSREEEARKARPPQYPHPRENSNSNQLGQGANKRRRLHSPPSESDDDVLLVPSSPAPSGSSAPPESDVPAGKVECPMCQKHVPLDKINPHIDSGCKRYLSDGSGSGTSGGPSGGKTTQNKNQQKQQWNSLFSGAGGGSKVRDKGKGKSRATPERDDDADADHLPKVAYDVHTRKTIAGMLAEWDLPTQGDKDVLAKRHKRWVILYNANVDRAPAHRHTHEQLRAELRKLEEADQRTRKETVDDPVAYQKAHKAAFAQLTAAARPKTKHESRSGTQRTQAADADVYALTTNGVQESVESAQGPAPEPEQHGHSQVGDNEDSDVIELDEDSDIS
ncbi:hypothetical protein C8Q74DRAFT_1342039 [Fomes fomentarius]|nr:hypothetical protein C8Q74DRAFT_1342039 [Fomes fomentarius]